MNHVRLREAVNLALDVAAAAPECPMSFDEMSAENPYGPHRIRAVHFDEPPHADQIAFSDAARRLVDAIEGTTSAMVSLAPHLRDLDPHGFVAARRATLDKRNARRKAGVPKGPAQPRSRSRKARRIDRVVAKFKAQNDARDLLASYDGD